MFDLAVAPSRDKIPRKLNGCLFFLLDYAKLFSDVLNQV